MLTFDRVHIRFIKETNSFCFCGFFFFPIFSPVFLVYEGWRTSTKPGDLGTQAGAALSTGQLGPICLVRLSPKDGMRRISSSFHPEDWSRIPKNRSTVQCGWGEAEKEENGWLLD